MLYRSILRPLLFRLDPETAHELALHALSTALGTEAARRAATKRLVRSPFGELQRFGLAFRNPVGLAAGFDKNGKLTRELAALGFGFIEVGTVTHKPQPGNPRPRLFRLPQDRALINRQGFNNEGAAALAARLQKHRPACVLGVNIGKSRIVEVADAVPDYLASFEIVFPRADYVAINVSSPNTPNLRELQKAEALSSLLNELQRLNRELATKLTRAPVPLLVKVSPDLSWPDVEMIVDVARRAKLAGIIATNTTVDRGMIQHTPPSMVEAYGAGGLSGQPLRASATEIIAALYRLARGSLTIIGVGGIFDAADAWEKICAGASHVQLYTGFVYEGVTTARDINEGLHEIMRREGFHSLDEAVGSRAQELSAISGQLSAINR
ncbi:MAG: quinone-dependent dihydroorotate dehydrogenase [Acidobacteriota bacterium]|nr:quinone-dependent dihydroorotate dehydrogenase [Acidobacteriota bacterium]